MNIAPNTTPKPYSNLAYAFGWNNQQLHFASKKHDSPSVASPEEILLKNADENDGGVRLMATGGSHSLVLMENGRLYAMGRNQEYQLGLGHQNDALLLEEIKLDGILQRDEQIVSLDCGDRHSVFVTNKYNVFAFGSNSSGQCGLGQRSFAPQPQNVETMRSKRIVKVVCGSRHTIFVTKAGMMWAAGAGSFGQLGNGKNQDVKYPVEVEQGDWKVIDVRSQAYTNIALSDDYSVYVWGGQGYKAGRDDSSPQAVNEPRRVCHNILGRRVIGVACAASHYYCLASDGSVYTFGHSLATAGYLKYVPHIMEVVNKYPSAEDQAQHLTKDQLEWRDALDLSSKFVVPSEFMKDVTLYRVQFLPSNDRVMGVECTDQVVFFITESGKVYSQGQAKFHELGLWETTEALKPQQIKELASEFVPRIVAGCWHAFALTGSYSNFASQHLNHGQTLPKVLERIEARIREEEAQ